MKPLTFLVACTLLLTIHCKRETSEPIAPPVPPRVIEYVQATILGRIIDETGAPVQDASIKANAGLSTTTDLNGYFRFTNVRLDKNAGLVIAEKAGFFQGSRTIVLREASTNYVTIRLIKKEIAGIVTSSGGTVTIANGGSIVFPANAFVNSANNLAYTGTSSVTAFFIDPAANNFAELMPGTLRGLNTKNEEKGLQSFGMLAVELSGEGGEKLQLARGKTAILTFPVPTALQAQAPATIPLWYFNDSTGLWQEEGMATKQGNNYVGTVSHFSFWNCDDPYTLVDFKAVIQDQNGIPMFPALVRMKTISDSVSSYGEGYTDSSGTIAGKIPSNKLLTLTVYNRCKTAMYTTTVGPLTGNTDMDTLMVNNGNGSQVTVSGTVINCNAAAVTNGYVDVSLEGLTHRAPIVNGAFNIKFVRCSAGPLNAFVTAYDRATGVSSTPRNFTIISAVFSAGQLVACVPTVPEYIYFNLNGTNHSYLPPTDQMTYKYIPALYPAIEVMGTRPGSNNDAVYLLFLDPNPINYGHMTAVWVRTGNTTYTRDRYNNTINITEFGPPGTGYVAGNVAIQVHDTLDWRNGATLNLFFRKKRQ